ncbi:MAG: NupC/NupG family nucleoside CNT transporter [Gammaproteobacteria bacterium]
MDYLPQRLTAVFGILVMLGIAWALSTERRRFPWRIVIWGMAIQFGLGLLFLGTPLGDSFFSGLERGVLGLLSFINSGASFVFGPLMDVGFSFALNVLPGIIVMGALFQICYHLGIAQVIVRGVAGIMSRTMGLSAAESLAAVANIFVGQTEAPLMVKPYISRMTESELFALMATGMATVAGSVMIAYTQFIGVENAGHLVTASLMSAPAALVIAKIMVPETETPITFGTDQADIPCTSVNVIDAAADGAIAAMKLAANILVLLIAFVALIEIVNSVIGGAGGFFGLEGLTLQKILGWILAPLVWCMGVPWDEATTVGSLIGIKTVVNEFVAYDQLGTLISSDAISARSATISSYALCGFANFSSVAILIGGIGGMAPDRKQDVARLGIRAIIAGTLATMLTGAIAGILL